MALLEQQWKSLAQAEWGDVEDAVLAQWDTLWERYAGLDTADPSGELRFRAVILEGFKVLLGPAQDEVDTSEGGGQQIQAEARFQHLKTLHDMAEAAYNRQLKTISLLGQTIGAIFTHSLTPPFPGQIDPGHPGYLGDPRYQRRVLGPL